MKNILFPAILMAFTMMLTACSEPEPQGPTTSDAQSFNNTVVNSDSRIYDAMMDFNTKVANGEDKFVVELAHTGFRTYAIMSLDDFYKEEKIPGEFYDTCKELFELYAKAAKEIFPKFINEAYSNNLSQATSDEYQAVFKKVGELRAKMGSTQEAFAKEYDLQLY